MTVFSHHPPAGAFATEGSPSRTQNERRALTLIRRQGEMSKADMARALGVSPPTAAALLETLADDGLLTREALQRGRVGQPSAPFALNPDGALAIGIKVGRRNCEAALLDLSGSHRASREEIHELPQPQKVLDFARRAVDEISGDLTVAQRKRIIGVGVAMPDELWAWTDEIGAPPGALDAWRGVDVAEMLGSALGVPTVSINDATAAAAGELFTSPKPPKDFLYVSVGWFIGGGVISEGLLYQGASGQAGALASMLVTPPKGTSSAETGAPVQLLNIASICTLAERLKPSGGAELLWSASDDWSGLGAALDEWVEQAADGITQASINAAAVLDTPRVVIDGETPAHVRAKLVNACIERFAKLDHRGIAPLAFTAGSLGRSARAVGAARLPLISAFEAELHKAAL